MPLRRGLAFDILGLPSHQQFRAFANLRPPRPLDLRLSARKEAVPCGDAAPRGLGEGSASVLLEIRDAPLLPIQIPVAGLFPVAPILVPLRPYQGLPRVTSRFPSCPLAPFAFRVGEFHRRISEDPRSHPAHSGPSSVRDAGSVRPATNSMVAIKEISRYRLNALIMLWGNVERRNGPGATVLNGTPDRPLRVSARRTRPRPHPTPESPARVRAMRKSEMA